MVRKRIVVPTTRQERGKRPRVAESSTPSQGTTPSTYKRKTHRTNNITSKEILYGKQTVREVCDTLGLTELFSHQDGWLEFWDNLHEYAYRKSILEFYTHLDVEENDGKLSIISTVKGVDFIFNEDDIARWFGLKAEGEFWFHYDNWPRFGEDVQVDREAEIQEYLWSGLDRDPTRALPQENTSLLD